MRKADKEWIRQTFKELITEALTVPVRMERKRDPKTGTPLTVPLETTEDVFLPDHWVEFLPFYEQTIRLCEEASQQSRNRSKQTQAAVEKLNEKVDAIGQLYIGLERPLKAIAALSDAIQDNKLTMSDHLELVYKKNEGDSK